MEVFNNSLTHSAGNLTATGTRHLSHFISDSQRFIFTIVNNVLLGGLVSLFGTIANVINLIIFYRHGLNTTINISFFALAIADLCGLIMQQWYSICVNPLFDSSGIPIMFIDVLYITAGVPREMFSRITCLITVYITAERCICIAFPLKVKQMITSRRTGAALMSIYIVTWITAVPLYCTSSIDWKFYPERNISLIGLVPRSITDTAESAVFIIHAIFGGLSFLAVILFTSILIRILGQKSAWRKTANLNPEKSEAVSNRDRRTITMIVLIASVLIICYTPAVLLCVTTFYEPEFNVGGSYFNEYQILWSFAFLFEAVNSSVNIFLYLKMSTKYRQTFWQLCPGCGKLGQNNQQ